MKTGTIKWKKGKVIVGIHAAICECGSVMSSIGSAGCSHNNEYTYFFQCPMCKIVDTTETYIKSEDMEKYGWKKVD
jgi:hypothetical protein